MENLLNMIKDLRVPVICGVAFCLLFSFLDNVSAKSRSTPAFSKKTEGKESRFSLEDPRVALVKIREAKSIKEPEEKTLPPGAVGSPYTEEEQEAVNAIEDLKKAFKENKFRPDGYGIEVGKEVILTLGSIKSRRAVKFLGELLVDENEIVELKGDIVESLRQIGDKKAVPDLNTHLAYLKKKKPADPMAGATWQSWIDKTQSVINGLEGK